MPPAACSDDSQRPQLACGRWTQDGLKLEVRVQTRCSVKKLGDVENGRLKLRLTAAPADGKANEQARRLLADSFRTGISRIELTAGARHRNKTFLIRDPGRIPPELLGN
ncbi:MAG TPA: DUF167 domain-containing protein [Chromatiales bacterium]|nr:DUF167 domain-containing protein [Chromatiales bacterium]